MLKLELDYAVDIKELSFNYGDLVILRNVNLSIKYGELVAIMGKSGSGKTTLLKIIAGLLKPSVGSVRVLGWNITSERIESIKGKIAYIPQTLGLIEGGSVLYNVLLARAPVKPIAFMAGYWGKDDIMEALDTLKLVGLENKAMSRVDKLSGGERQRVAIARALFQRAQLLLADEPVLSLDYETAESIIRLIASLKSRNLTIIAVLHDKEFAYRYFDKIYVIDNGTLKMLR